jgi:hypothetical protein
MRATSLIVLAGVCPSLVIALPHWSVDGVTTIAVSLLPNLPSSAPAVAASAIPAPVAAVIPNDDDMNFDRVKNKNDEVAADDDHNNEEEEEEEEGIAPDAAAPAQLRRRSDHNGFDFLFRMSRTRSAK